MDISIAHRMPKGRSDDTRPIMVRFAARQIRDKVYVARKALRQSRCHIYVNEHLTKSNESLFRECRGLWKNKKIAGTWTCTVLFMQSYFTMAES